SSGYYGMLLLLALGLTLAAEWWRARDLHRLVRAGLAVGLAVAAATPVFLEYRAMQERHGFTRGRREGVAWGGALQSYLEPGTAASLPHTVALRRLARDGEPLFPGTWALVFGLGGLALLRKDREAWLPAAWLLLGLGLSLGPVLVVAGHELPGPFV